MQPLPSSGIKQADKILTSYTSIFFREFTILALLLISFGTGGIKPCVSAFGGDQFKLPEQEKYLGYFFSLFYFAINAGSLISTFLTPILRADVHCFGENDCYSLAFGVPGILMVVSISKYNLPIFITVRIEFSIANIYIAKQLQRIVLLLLMWVYHCQAEKKTLQILVSVPKPPQKPVTHS